jgi:hypothetical protein
MKLWRGERGQQLKTASRMSIVARIFWEPSHPEVVMMTTTPAAAAASAAAAEVASLNIGNATCRIRLSAPELGAKLTNTLSPIRSPATRKSTLAFLAAWHVMNDTTAAPRLSSQNVT